MTKSEICEKYQVLMHDRPEAEDMYLELAKIMDDLELAKIMDDLELEHKALEETDTLIALQEAKDTIATIKGNLKYALRSRDDSLIKQTVISTLAML